MRILHVASFRGNAGDNANHNGLRRMLRERIWHDAQYDEMEIRQFYSNYIGSEKKRFDFDFVRRANRYDLVIIGGGNFFEVWLEDSATGCTIDMTDDVVRSLRTKVLFFGLGFDRYKGCSGNTLAKFYHFIESLQDKKRFLVTVRNDGSLAQFVDSYGQQASRMVCKVPDGGFFVGSDLDYPPLVKDGPFTVVVSLARDMPAVRYGAGRETRGHRCALEAFAAYICQVIDCVPGACFVLAPHIYSDVGIIGELLELLPDHIRRERVHVGPYVTGARAVDVVFSNYKAADLVVGMRFHANVCAIGMGVPTIGLGTYRKIEDLYRELGIERRLVKMGAEGAAERLLDLTLDIYTNPEKYRTENRRIMNSIAEEMSSFIEKLKRFTAGG